MTAKLQMMTRARYGFSNKAQLNPALLGALAASAPGCDACVEIQKDILPNPEGAEYVEAASFPGRTVRTLDAHFRSHWKNDYELVDLSGRGDVSRDGAKGPGKTSASGPAGG
jgi:hypothetical protein